MEIYYLKNKDDNKEYTLDTYARMFSNIVYSDIECIAKHIDGDAYYILDECGNYDFIDNTKWEIVFTDEKSYRQKILNKELL